MNLISSALLLIAEFVKRHPGTVFVFVGVVGEGIEICAKFIFRFRSSKFDRILDLIGGVFWIVLVIGLTIEFKEAAKNDNDVALLEAQNLVLRSNVAVLESKMQPQNQPWLNTLAFVTIKVRGRNSVEVPPSGGPRVASVVLCPSKLAATVGASDGFPSLDSEKFERGIIIFTQENARVYSMRFQPGTFGDGFLKNNKKAGELDAVNFLSIWLKFLPLDADILGGEALVIVNDNIIKEFKILPQKAFAPLILTNTPDYRDAYRIISTFGTNELPTNPGPEVR